MTAMAKSMKTVEMHVADADRCRRKYAMDWTMTVMGARTRAAHGAKTVRPVLWANAPCHVPPRAADRAPTAPKAYV